MVVLGLISGLLVLQEGVGGQTLRQVCLCRVSAAALHAFTATFLTSVGYSHPRLSPSRQESMRGVSGNQQLHVTMS